MTPVTDSRRGRMSQLVQDVVTTILPDVPAHAVGGGRSLKDLGADSVDRVEIIAALIDRTGIDAPMSSFTDVPDIEALVEFLCQAQR